MVKMNVCKSGKRSQQLLIPIRFRLLQALITSRKTACFKYQIMIPPPQSTTTTLNTWNKVIQKYIKVVTSPSTNNVLLVSKRLKTISNKVITSLFIVASPYKNIAY